MRPRASLPVRLVIAAAAFVAVFCIAVAATYLSFSGLKRGRAELLSLSTLLLVWSLLAYFPSRQAYVALLHRKPGDGVHCQNCGYDLTGNQSGICPECGHRVTARVPVSAMTPASEPPMHSGSRRSKRLAVHLMESHARDGGR